MREVEVHCSPRLIDIRPAREIIPEIRGKIGFAGPPLRSEQLLRVHRQAVFDILLLEDIISDSAFSGICEIKEQPSPETQDRELCHAFESLNLDLQLVSNWELGIVAPLVGIITESMPLMVIEDARSNSLVYVPIHEGSGESFRFGSLSRAAVERMRWIKDCFAPILGLVVREAGGIDLLPIMQEGLWMGDELHMRTAASSQAFALCVGEALLGCNSISRTEKEPIWSFLRKNSGFFLNLAMGAAKLFLESCARTSNSGCVVACAANGTDIGIQVAGKPGVWFTAPAPQPIDAAREGSEPDAQRVCSAIGDSMVVEAMGLGGRVTLISPSLWTSLGISSLDQERDYEQRVRQAAIGVGADLRLPMPFQDFLDVPVGLDVETIVDHEIPIIVNTARVGQNGAFCGVGRLVIPLDCFVKAREETRSPRHP